MARPKRFNADYFSHDAGMRDDPKVKALRNKFGITGYAIWCMFLEVLTNSDHFKREIDEMEMEILAADFGIEVELFADILSYMLRLRLLQTVGNCEYLSQKLCDRLQSVTDKRRNSAKRGISVTESTQSKGKETKEEESTNSSSWLDTAKTEYLDFCEKYFLMLKENGKVKKNTNWKTEAWYKAARLLVERDGETLVKMYQALQHVSDNIDDQYFPQVWSVPSLREKWLKVDTHSQRNSPATFDPNKWVMN